MKSRNFADYCKNAMGTVFLLAGAFLVCSTLVSIRAVFADPIAPIATSTVVAGPQATRAGTASPRTTNATSRRTATNTVSRGTTTTATASRAVTSRGATARTTATPTPARTATTAATRATTTSASARPSVSASRATANTVSRGAATTSGRNVVSRGTVANASRATTNRNVVSRAGTTARVSLQGSAIRGSKAATNSTTYTYLQNRLYTGNYSNIIDSTTGLISADAYNNCMESYYACMDEICTARNAAQRRCACAGRVKAFAEAEAALEQANEELIKVSGELALLIATKGKDVSQAFQLTDAEKVMNCVSWKDASKNGTATEDEFGDWCEEHALFDETCSNKSAPSYCEEGGNNFGFDIDSLDGSGSDILASLQSWADAKEATFTILEQDNNNLLDAFDNLTSVVGNLAGISGSLADSENLKDSLAETWGYELFEYAHKLDEVVRTKTHNLPSVEVPSALCLHVGTECLCRDLGLHGGYVVRNRIDLQFLLPLYHQFVQSEDEVGATRKYRDAHGQCIHGAQIGNKAQVCCLGSKDLDYFPIYKACLNLLVRVDEDVICRYKEVSFYFPGDIKR